jgi:hypothetical protein
MNIEFRFNGTQQLILTPENKKDEQLIQLFIGGNKSVKFVTPPAASPTSLVMESFDEGLTHISGILGVGPLTLLQQP